MSRVILWRHEWRVDGGWSSCLAGRAVSRAKRGSGKRGTKYEEGKQARKRTPTPLQSLSLRTSALTAAPAPSLSRKPWYTVRWFCATLQRRTRGMRSRRVVRIQWIIRSRCFHSLPRCPLPRFQRWLWLVGCAECWVLTGGSKSHAALDVTQLGDSSPCTTTWPASFSRHTESDLR